MDWRRPPPRWKGRSPELWTSARTNQKPKLPKRPVWPQAVRAIFADGVAVADGAEKLGADRVPSVAKFAVPPRLRYPANPASLELSPGMKAETTALVAVIVPRVVNPTHASSALRPRRRRGLVATTITDRHRDINRSCFRASPFRSISAKVAGRVPAKKPMGDE